MNSEEKSHHINKILADGESTISAILLNLSKSSIERRLSEFDRKYAETRKRSEEWHECTRLILEEVGKTVFQIFEIAKKSPENLIFYFWPGYTTLRNKERVFIKGREIRTWSKQEPNFYNGIGFNGTIEKEFRDCPATLYFTPTLTPITQIEGNKLPENKKIIPPTTHYWKINQPESVNFKLKDGSIFNILHISTNKTTSYHKKGVISISFDKNNTQAAFKSIYRTLNTNSVWRKDACISRKKYKFIPWPHSSSIKAKSNRNLRKLQRISYIIWFEAVFVRNLDYLSIFLKDLIKNGNSNKYRKKKDWLMEIIEKDVFPISKEFCKRLSSYCDLENELVGRKKNSVQNNLYSDNTFFTDWYTLFFESFDPKNELGSTMFLSNQTIDYEYLLIAQNWIKYIYSQIRNLDYSIDQERIRIKTISDLQHDTLQFLGYANYLIDTSEKNNYKLDSILLPIRYAMEEWINAIKINGLIVNRIYETKIINISLETFLKEILKTYEISIRQANGGFLHIRNSLADRLSELRFKYFISPVDVSFDSMILKFLVGNLLSNAIKASLEDETPNVTVKLDTSFDSVTLSISNNGKVLDRQFIEYLETGHGEEYLPKGRSGLKSIRNCFILSEDFCKLRCNIDERIGYTTFYLTFLKFELI